MVTMSKDNGEIDEIVISKYLKGMVICHKNGTYLLDLILDTEINPVLLSSFVGALALFGAENVGKIEEIIVKGLDIQMIIVNKYDLILVAILAKDFVKEDIRNEAEKALDMFYSLYKDCFKDCIDISIFEPFKNLLREQIISYFTNFIGQKEKEKEVADFGFFTEAIMKMRNLNK